MSFARVSNIIKETMQFFYKFVLYKFSLIQNCLNHFFKYKSDPPMRRLIVICFCMLLAVTGYSQASVIYQRGLAAEENLKAISSLGPYTQGGIGFDNRYEGIVGTTRLLDTLLPSFLRIRGQDYYIQLLADIDLVNNSLIYIHPKTRKLLTVPADVISELIIQKDGKELLFRTTSGKTFDKEIKEPKFYQVLNNGPYQFIKIPHKTFVQADYKGAYSADRRFDEYQTKFKYYLKNPDSVFCQIQLTRKSILKLYPDKKAVVEQAAGEESFADKEEMILSLLEKF
jgi:hypothetical protein